MEQKCRCLFFQVRLIIVSIVLLLFSGCNLGNSKKPFAILNFKQATQGRLIDSYNKYCEDISSLEFPIASFQSKPAFFASSGFTQKILVSNDFAYLVSASWQVYALKDTERHRTIAQKLSKILESADRLVGDPNGERIQNLLTPYLITKDQEYQKYLLSSLNKYISNVDKEMGSDFDSTSVKDLPLERLLCNQAMFSASKETGDPVYKIFALKQSDLILEKYFENRLIGKQQSGLIDYLDSTTESFNSLKLAANDYANLAIGLYGFAFLYKETGLDKYRTLSQNIASIFTSRMNQQGKASSGSPLWSKTDLNLLSMALVCNALFDLGTLAGDPYREASINYYDHLLNLLENSGKMKEEPRSFRLFYYLFEYERKRQNIE